MRTPLAKFIFLVAASAVALVSCTGSEESGPSSPKMMFPTPGHLMLDGRVNSRITIYGVAYPRTDHTRSTPDEMVIDLPDIPAGSTGFNGYMGEAIGRVGVTLPGAQQGEIAHNTQFGDASVTEDPVGRNSFFAPSWGDRTVGYIQLMFRDEDHGIHYQCWTAINLEVLHGTPSEEDIYYADADGNRLQDSDVEEGKVNWSFRVYDFEITYTGVVTSGKLKVTAQEQVDGEKSSGFDDHIDLSNLEFEWTCHETRIVPSSANAGRALPLAPY